MQLRRDVGSMTLARVKVPSTVLSPKLASKYSAVKASVMTAGIDMAIGAQMVPSPVGKVKGLSPTFLMGPST